MVDNSAGNRHPQRELHNGVEDHRSSKNMSNNTTSPATWVTIRHPRKLWLVTPRSCHSWPFCAQIPGMQRPLNPLHLWSRAMKCQAQHLHGQIALPLSCLTALHKHHRVLNDLVRHRVSVYRRPVYFPNQESSVVIWRQPAESIFSRLKLAGPSTSPIHICPSLPSAGYAPNAPYKSAQKPE